MQQLITIETVPISIKYTGTRQATPAEDSGPAAAAPENGGPAVRAANPDVPSKHHTHLKAVRPRTDSFVQGGASGNYNLTYTATPKYDAEGRMSLDIKMGGGEGDSFHALRFGRDIQNVIGRILGGGQESSYDIDGMELNIDFADIQKAVPGSGQSGKAFTPPSFEIEILEMPKVIVKYVGGPIYIPRSADPNYEAPEE
ncbi:hypothetical protein MASR2M70_19560 [Bacillota bacterium]